MRLHASRILPTACAAFCAVTALGGFALGFGADDGQALALACLLAGIALACGLWLRYGQDAHNMKGLNRLMVLMFCLMAGLALYSNLSYLLWGIGYPMAIRAFETGAMDGHSWLPPLTLLWTVLCWWGIDKRK